MPELQNYRSVRLNALQTRTFHLVGVSFGDFLFLYRGYQVVFLYFRKDTNLVLGGNEFFHWEALQSNNVFDATSHAPCYANSPPLEL